MTPPSTSIGQRRERLAAGGLLLLAALLLLPGLGTAPLERAEIYFVDVARAMLERGDLVVPYYRGVPFFDKPVLTYWLMAAAFRAFGFTAEAARLVPALATLLAILGTLWLGRRTVGPRAAVAGALALVTTPAFLGFGRVAMSDALLALFTVASVALGLQAYAGARWALPLLGAALGCGFLTKGPIALLLPGLGLLLLAFLRRPQRPPRSASGSALALLLFALVGLGWFAVVYARLGAGPLEYFFLRENLQRFAAATYDTGRPPWYYLFTYLAQGAPWSLFLPLAALRLVRPWAADDSERRGARFLLGWLGLMLVPLTLSRGKLDYYLLPLYPAAALVVGDWLVARPWETLDRGWARGVALALAGALLLSLGLPAGIAPGWRPGAPALTLVAAAAVLLAGLLVGIALRPRPTALLLGLAAAAAASFVAFTLVFLPAFRAGQPNARIVADVSREQAFRPDLRLALCDDPVRVQRDILFQTRIAVDERCDLYGPMASRLPFLLLLTREQWSLAETGGLRHVGSYAYLPATVYGLRGLLEGVAPSRVGLYANFATDDPRAEWKARRERRRYFRELEQAEEPRAKRRKGPRRHRRAADPPA